MPALLKQAGAYNKQCDLVTIVLERSILRTTRQQANDERMVEDIIRTTMQQAKCRKEERMKQQNTIQQHLTHVKQQKLVAEEVESEVKAAGTRFGLLERTANCGSRSANCTTWGGISMSAIKHFDIEHNVKNKVFPPAILEAHNAGIVAKQNAQMAANAQDNFIGAVVGEKVLNDETITVLTAEVYEIGPAKRDTMDDTTALADAAAMADDIAEDSNLKPAAVPVANAKAAPKFQLPATNVKSNGEGFAAGLNNLKSPPEMNLSKKQVPAVSLASSGHSVESSFVLDDLSLKLYEATSTNSSSGAAQGSAKSGEMMQLPQVRVEDGASWV